MYTAIAGRGGSGRWVKVFCGYWILEKNIFGYWILGKIISGYWILGVWGILDIGYFLFLDIGYWKKLFLDNGYFILLIYIYIYVYYIGYFPDFIFGYWIFEILFLDIRILDPPLPLDNLTWNRAPAGGIWAKEHLLFKMYIYTCSNWPMRCWGHWVPGVDFNSVIHCGTYQTRWINYVPLHRRVEEIVR